MTDEPEMTAEEQIIYGMAGQVVQLVVAGSAPGQTAGTVDPDAAIDGLLMGLALILEQAPEFDTNQSMRRGCEQVGKRLHRHAKLLRMTFEQTGIHPIDHVIDRFGEPGAAN